MFARLFTIPSAALGFGLAGALPFLALGIAATWAPDLSTYTLAIDFLCRYALTILAFMSGCIWAFAAKHDDMVGIALSTLPALYGCFATVFARNFGPETDLVLLALGFLVLLALDRRAARLGQTPVWWMPLRLLLTTLVVSSLGLGAIL